MTGNTNVEKGGVVHPKIKYYTVVWRNSDGNYGEHTLCDINKRRAAETTVGLIDSGVIPGVMEAVITTIEHKGEVDDPHVVKTFKTDTFQLGDTPATITFNQTPDGETTWAIFVESLNLANGVGATVNIPTKGVAWEVWFDEEKRIALLNNGELMVKVEHSTAPIPS